MNWPDSTTLNLWALFGSFLLLCVLGIYTWRHRDAPAAGPILALLLLRGFWIIFRVLELGSADLETKLLWFHLGRACLPLFVAAGISVLAEFTRPGNWLGRRNIALLHAPAVIITLLILTNPAHGLVWNRLWLDEFLRASRTPFTWAFAFYFYCLFLLEVIRLVNFAVRWSMFRWSAALLLVGCFTAVIVDVLVNANVAAPGRVDLRILAFNFLAIVYVLVAIGMRRVLDILPVARRMAIERMQDGIAVINAQGGVVYQNPVAQVLLGYPWQITGDGAVAGATDLMVLIRRSVLRPTEILVEYGAEQKQYAVQATPLEDPRGWQLGDLLIFQDITDRVLARRLRVQQQRALAVLEERERIAGELHDDLGQVLGYVKLQMQAAQDLLLRKDYAGADRALSQLICVTQEAHTDVREFILGAVTTALLQRGFAPVLEGYLEQLNNSFGLRTQLHLSPTWDEASLEPVVTVQLLRIVQEALTNARKHAQAETVIVNLAVVDGQTRITITDDGQGFEPERLAESQGLSFGLGFMRRRVEGIGGKMKVQSVLGQGTQVIVSVPLQQGQA